MILKKKYLRVNADKLGKRETNKMRRNAGLGAINKKKLAESKFKEKGYELAQDQLNELSKHLEQFREHLQDFAAKHKNEIKKNPTFRRQFQDMCASVGVDPLASGKGFWSEMLGVGDFYYELGVQIVEICMATTPRNGGLMPLEELRERLSKARSRKGGAGEVEISMDDLQRAIKKLKVLGNGFTVIPISGGGGGNNGKNGGGETRFLVQSVPGELSTDHTSVLATAEEGGGAVGVQQLVKTLGWEVDRAQRALDHLVKEGLAWVDDQGKQTLYWFPALFKGAVQSF